MSKYKNLIIVFSIFVILFVFLYFQNNAVVLTRFFIDNKKLPEEFADFRIIHLSDIHSKVYKKSNQKIIRLIEKERPDIIVITGDLIDRRRYNEEKALMLIDELKNIAPIYFVTGNHEAWSGKFDSLEGKLVNREVKVLRNEKEILKKGQGQIEIIGLDDPAFNTKGYQESYKDYSIIDNNLNLLLEDTESFTILLSHRPEFFPLYAEKGIDLSFTGHAHGGQIIIPFVGGIIAPNQGFFPQYYRGRYEIGDSVMLLNAGLGNSIIPQRIFNRPEIISVKLQSCDAEGKK